MSLPKHQNPALKDRMAIAPYNFVLLPEKIVMVEAEDIPFQDRYSGYTGYFECDLETSSPTYIRGMMLPDDTDEAKDHPEPFSLDGGKTPLLPGSSLRGMFRTLLEVVTYAKMNFVTNEGLVYRSVGDTSSHGQTYRQRIMQENPKNNFAPLMKAGYIRKQGLDWAIQPATEMDGTTWARLHHNDIPKNLAGWHRCKNASQIYIQPGPLKYQDVRGGFLKIKYAKVLRVSDKPGNGLQAAVLVRSGAILKKNSEAVIFSPDPKKSLIPISPEMVQTYRDQVSKEQMGLLGNQGVLQDMQPVFYLMENGKLTFFGHTMMLRLPYTQSPQDLVLKQYDKGIEQTLDLVEAMFGYVDKERTGEKGKKSKTARAGRLFFSDAHCLPNQPNLLETVIVPQILAGPKPTTFQHYLVQPQPDDKQGLLDYDSKDTTLRGFKLYWHKGNLPLNQIAEADKRNVEKHGSQYTRIQPIRAGVRFKATIRFESLTLLELGALVWLLQMVSQPDYRLKIGMGKPLGMGALQIKATLHLTDRQARYQRLFSDNQWATGELDAPSIETIQQQALTEFTHELLSNSQINWQGKATLTELPRLKMLLKMLSWPGPSPALTRYMEIEHIDPQAKRGKRNEYRDRPVLPDPLHVEATTAPRAATTTPRPATQSSAPKVPYQTVTEETPPPAKATPRQPEMPEVGDNFTGKVIQIETNGDVIIEHPKFSAKQLRVVIKVENLAGKNLQMGNPAKCEVVEQFTWLGKPALSCKPGQKKGK